MTTEAQIAANRRNAEASTGPITAEGKAASRANALRHGLAARHPIALGEGEADFLAYCDEMRRTLEPADAVEEALVRRAALCGWRLDRLYRVEAALFDETSRVTAWRQGRGATEAPDAWPEEMTSLARYEGMLDRGFQRALVELERRRQAMRRAGAAFIRGIGDCKTKNYQTNPIFAGIAKQWTRGRS